VIDLRAEEDLRIPTDLLADLDLTRVAIPIRDGQTPTDGQVQRFLDAVDSSDGTVYLHCGAGVGRTGTMAAVYRVSRGGGGWSAMRANLAVGPPSLEQLAYAAALDAGEAPERPNLALVAVSRTLDAPRRIFKVLGL
ncbi:MAG: protein-tyrosine phosphatase family protein, partial [Acidimicrobiales bacterium]